MEPSEERIRCSVGILAHNEEKNIGTLLQAMIDQSLHRVEITEIIVVASGCTDETIPIVEDYQERDSRIKLLVQPSREGKTAAINLFLQEAKEDICVQESADTLPREDAVEHLVRMFADPTIGMTGAHKLPVDTPDHLAQVFTHLRLRMEHQLCMDIPRLGEMIAYRKVFDRIPPDVAMDEAFVEALVVQRGMQVKYAPDAVVYNTGPTTVKDFVKQRRRNHAGHLYLKHKYDYAVSSIQTSRVVKVALKEAWGVVRLLGVLAALAILEGWSRFLGWYDFAIKKDRHMVWDMAYTQKADVAKEHEDSQSQSDTRSTAAALLVKHDS
ncbi:MAG TPA: glycosyltransferase [Anaerolineae bacterium]|jgi:biofilm PGA synthesis N-glycosyltransferase PgaC|nr:glycosyltransferase [Anaerolineae bacterium]